jgi:hypothetical protein
VLGGLLKLIQINLACVFENGTRARDLVRRSHDSDQKFTRLDPRLILERFIFREAQAMSAIGTPAFSSFRTACFGFFMRLVGGND